MIEAFRAAAASISRDNKCVALGSTEIPIRPEIICSGTWRLDAVGRALERLSIVVMSSGFGNAEESSATQSRTPGPNLAVSQSFPI